MTEITTETGFYVLCDSEGRVISKANVPIGKHPVVDVVDPSESYDVDTEDDLNAVEINPHYASE